MELKIGLLVGLTLVLIGLPISVSSEDQEQNLFPQEEDVDLQNDQP